VTGKDGAIAALQDVGEIKIGLIGANDIGQAS
jgi:hypothetical protein